MSLYTEKGLLSFRSDGKVGCKGQTPEFTSVFQTMPLGLVGGLGGLKTFIHDVAQIVYIQ